MTFDPKQPTWPVGLGAAPEVHDHCEIFRWDWQRRLVFRTEQNDTRLSMRVPAELHALRSPIYEVTRGWEWIVSCVHIDYAWGLLDVFYPDGERGARIGGGHATTPEGYRLTRPLRVRELLPIRFELVLFKSEDLRTELMRDIDIVLVGALVRHG